MSRAAMDPMPVILILALLACCSPNESRSMSAAGPALDDRADPPVTTAPTTSTAPAAARRPRTREREQDRLRMVQQQIAARGIKDARVLAAMRAVPRHWFVPDRQRFRAYDDGPLPIGHDQTISQPYIVALMTEALALKPGDKVLEIGTGSGYQAAILAELVDDVYTIEIVRPLAERTIALFKTRGYEAIRTRIGDGYRGWPEAAPFDAIIVTCAPDAPPQPLIDQLAVGGRMCIPVGDGPFSQQLILITKQPDGSLQRRTIAPVAFVPMTGEAQRDRR